MKTVLVNTQSSWSSGRGVGQPLLLTGRIYIPSSRVYYVPGPWEVLKFGWIQYLSYLLLVGLVLWIGFQYLLKSNILVSSVSEQPSYQTASALESTGYTALKSFAY